MLIQVTDITGEYTAKTVFRPGRLGSEPGYETATHQDEIETAKWLCETFGGDLMLLTESVRQGVKTPDYR